MDFFEILISSMYVLSLVYFVIRFWLMGVCHGDARSAEMAKQLLVVSFVLFILMTIVASVFVSVWFVTPLALFIVTLLIWSAVDAVLYRIKY